MSIQVRSEYTPEKVAELVAEARYDAKVFLGLNVGTLLAHLAAALTAVSADVEMWKQETDDAKAYAALVDADRDRLHKAITEALAFESVLPAIATEPRRILRAALDQEGEN